ncbi:uncharacterized protein LOC116199883 isoform X4 [Punica granatum]|uniref:Uncharacterized protein LOC116199883 isoform X4 n=1 Tax=Punica granatum TaxID=22663 RepID=A0A6P8CWD0_PUNGR|nr:uncharacterized protein LOC116199883 isoform X4 [Punica granatum]
MMIQSSTFSTVALPFKPRIFSCCLHKSASPTPSPSSSGPAESSGFELGKAFINTGLCCCCGRRHFIESAAAASAAALCPVHSSNAASDLSSDYKAILNRVHPPRPNWYEEFYAQVMDMTMQSYEAEIAGYKSQLFDELKGEAKEVVEIGVGTGPNFRYYVGNNSVRVIGVDPNRAMEKYAQAAAEGAGLLPEKFQFLQAVGEAIPVRDASVDAVIGTLVLCSVGDVDQTLKEIYNLPTVAISNECLLPARALNFLYKAPDRGEEGAQTGRSLPIRGACCCRRGNISQAAAECS